LLPEIKAYMAKARLRRGIEIIKLANRIEALKMQEDESDDIPDVMADVPTEAKPATGDAFSGHDAASKGPSTTSADASTPGSKKSLSKIAKGAIFREVVLAKVREMKESEKRLQVEKDAQDKAAKRNSFQTDK